MTKNRYRLTFIFLAIIFLCGCSSASTSLIQKPTVQDADQVGELREFLIKNHVFKTKSVQNFTGPAVYSYPGAKGIFSTKPHHIIIFGVTDESEQLQIESIVSKYKRQHDIFPVVIHYHADEESERRAMSTGKRLSTEFKNVNID